MDVACVVTSTYHQDFFGPVCVVCAHHRPNLILKRSKVSVTSSPGISALIRSSRLFALYKGIKSDLSGFFDDEAPPKVHSFPPSPLIMDWGRWILPLAPSIRQNLDRATKKNRQSGHNKHKQGEPKMGSLLSEFAFRLWWLCLLRLMLHRRYFLEEGKADTTGKGRVYVTHVKMHSA